jgi:hypothetical protein
VRFTEAGAAPDMHIDQLVLISELRTPFQATASKWMSMLTGEVHNLRGLGRAASRGKVPHPPDPSWWV